MEPADSDFYKAALSHLLSHELSVSPEVHCTLVLIDDVSVPLIHRPNSEPLVPRWMVQLKLLWPHESNQLSGVMPTGTAPSIDELQLMDALNDRCLLEYGSHVCLAGSRDCSLLPFSQVMRGYQASRVMGWRRDSRHAGCEMRHSTRVFRLGLNGCLCPSVVRDGLPLLPAALLVGILPDADWQLLISSGLGVTCTPEEMQTLQQMASSLRLPWNSAVSETCRQRLIPVSSVARLAPRIQIEELQLRDFAQPTLKCPCEKCVTPPHLTAGNSGKCPCEKCVKLQLAQKQSTGKKKQRKQRKQKQQSGLTHAGPAVSKQTTSCRKLKNRKRRQASYSTGQQKQLKRQKTCKPATALQTACCCKSCALSPSSLAPCPQHRNVPIPLPTSSGHVGQLEDLLSNYLLKYQ